MHKKTCLIQFKIFLFLALLVNPMSALFAQGKTASGKSQVKALAKEMINEKSLGFSLSTNVSAKTDLADERKTKKYSNAISVSTGYAWEDYSISGSTSYRFISLNNDVVDNQYSIDGLSDSSLSFGILTFANISASLPTSSESQYEGIKGTLGGGVGYQHEIPVNGVSLSHGLAYEYIFNTFTHSPTNNEATREMALSYSLSATLDFFSTSALNFGFGAQTVKLNDGSIEMGSSVNSSVGIGYTYRFKKLSMAINYSTGDFLDDKLQNNWFLNQYQQIVSLKLGYKWF